MEDWQKGAIAAMLALIVALGSFILGFGIASDEPLAFFGGNGSNGADVITEAYEDILNGSVSRPSQKELREGAIRGMIEVLQKNQDPYASFYDPRSYDEILETTQGNFSGIGVTLQQEGKDLRIIRVLPGSPAQAEGVRGDDVITKVGSRTVTPRNADRLVERIKGPAGTDVDITVRRKGRSIGFTITRAKLELPNVSARMTKAGNAYLRVYGFAKGAGRQTREQLDRLVDKGAEGVILDLRNNPGGLFREAINISSLFIEDGDVVIYKQNDGSETVYEAEGDAYGEIPLVVLVNGASASASEIVAGALQDNDRGQIVGTRTYGKASVQQVEELSDNSAVKLTVASYLTPDGRDIDKEGVKPDVTIADPRLQSRRAEALLEDEVASAGEQG